MGNSPFIRFRRLPVLLLPCGVLCFCALLLADPGADQKSHKEPPPKKTDGTDTGDDDSSSEKKAKAGSTGKREVDMSEIPADTKAEQKELKALGTGFQLYRTLHFSVLHNVTDDKVKAFATAIEKTYRSNVNYTMTLDIEPKKPAKKLLIYYFAQHQEYTDYSEKLGKGKRPQSNPGVYFPDLNRSMFYDFRNQDIFKKAREDAEAKVAELKKQLATTKTPEQRAALNKQITEAKAMANRSGVVGGGYTETTVQHEVTHHVLWNVGYHNPKLFMANPRWFAEGTAMMFETAGSGKASNIGAVNKQRLDEYHSLEKANKLLKIKDLIGTPAAFVKEDTIGTAYAESWALAHYLNRTKRAQIKGFVEQLNKRSEDYASTSEKEIATFEKAFGKLDEKWETQWKNWMKNVR